MKLSNGEKIVRAALLCTGCDIPARKVCGFKGFGTSRGCNRSLKEMASQNLMLISTNLLAKAY